MFESVSTNPFSLGAGENVYDLSIARQGDRLAYAQLSVDFNIYRVELTGQPGARRGAAAPVSFISSTRMEETPQFSPDGRRVGFTSNRSGSATNSGSATPRGRTWHS
jgi:Tol biopolymer transport system component